MHVDALRSLRFRAPWQRSLRDHSEPINWRKFTLGAAVAVVMTVLELAGFDRGMQRHAFDERQRGAIVVSLIDETPMLEIIEPPLPEPEPLKRRPSAIRIDTPAIPTKPPPPVAAEENNREMKANIGSAGSAARLFDASGRVRLPDAASRSPEAVAKSPQQQAREKWKAMQERGENPLDCERTRFAAAFRKDQSMGDVVAGKYLGMIGLANRAAIAQRLKDREERAADGCDPPR